VESNGSIQAIVISRGSLCKTNRLRSSLWLKPYFALDNPKQQDMNLSNPARLSLQFYPIPSRIGNEMVIGVLKLHLFLPGCRSLKEKRGRIKPLIARLQREFNLSVSEIDLHDNWKESLIACVMVSSDLNVLQASLEKVITFTEHFFKDLELFHQQIEII
jgi:hypothetical protein